MDHTRHEGIFNLSQASVTLIGAGGIGSPLALALSKMGLGFLRTFDFDLVSEENPATQLYGVSDVGRAKVEALGGILGYYGDEDMLHDIYDARYDGAGDQIIVSAVDSIKVRKEIWELMDLANQPTCDWYVDLRMGAESFAAHVVRHPDIDWYDTLLSMQSDEAVPDLPCTEKATAYTGWIAGGYGAKIVKDIVVGQRMPRKIVIDLPHNAISVIEAP